MTHKERCKAYYRDNKARWTTPERKAQQKAYRATNSAARLEANRARREAARKYVAVVKSAPCADCEQSFPYFVMDLDHVRGEKLSDVSSMVDNGFSLARIKIEIEKCDVVCSNCHRLRTHLRRGTDERVMT